MNERMAELYKEACEFAYNICKEEGRTGGHNDHIWVMLSTGKFAELIVQECIGYLNAEANRLEKLAESEHRTEFREDFISCADKCLDNIQGLKEHFGVEK